MRKSLVTLVLITMLATSFITAVESISTPTDETLADDMDQLDERLEQDQWMNDRPEKDDSGEFTVPQNDRIDPAESPVLIFHDVDEGRPWPYHPSDDDPTRGATNTSTLLYIQKAPKQVHYGDKMELEGLLLEDNNSDGERNSGDLPIMKEFVHLNWADGTEWMFEADLMTEWDNQEENYTAGRFSMPSSFLWNYDENGNKTDQVQLYANISSTAINPVELLLTYKGVWTTDGARFYNITQETYNVLYDKKIGSDDDGDAQAKQNNHMDDDGDGEPNSPNSYLDGSNGFPADGIYQIGEDVDYDRNTAGWIQTPYGLADNLDNDGDGEALSPDSYHDGSNSKPGDGTYQVGEDIGRDRYESHYTISGYTVQPGATDSIDLGSLGAGAVVNYNFSVNRTDDFDLVMHDGTTADTFLSDSSGAVGQYEISDFGNYTFRFVSKSSSVCSISYEIEITEQQEKFFWNISALGTNSLYLGEIPSGTSISYNFAENNWTTPFHSAFNMSLQRGSQSPVRYVTNQPSATGTIMITATDTYTFHWESGNATDTTNISYQISIDRPELDDPGINVRNGFGHIRDIGDRGKADISYSWYANGDHPVDFGYFDGTSTTWISSGTSNGTGTFTLPAWGTYSLVWDNPNNYDVRIGYDIDVDVDWIDMDMAIADNLDNDGDGMYDEGIDESIDDGRPSIQAFGTPEDSTLWNNGVDDDNDGIVDDGYPGIKKNSNPEGVDEEILNGIDDDNDGYIDEDPYAFIARRGYEKKLYVEIWHKTKTVIDGIEPSHGVVDVGDKFTITGSISDISYEETVMGAKTMRMFWDGQPMFDAVARPSTTGYFSTYEFTFTVPQDASAGPHEVTVEFSPGFNITNNLYFDPSNATTTVYVRRPTKVLFDNIDPNYGVTWVYRGNTIYINGSIVDELYYQRNQKEGPQLQIAGYDYGTKYRFNVEWGDSIQPFYKIWTGQFITDDNGTFSLQYELPAGSQPLGPVEVTVETNFDDNPYQDDKVFYTNSENSTTFIVRSTTEMALWMDQNLNDVNDEKEVGPNGEPLDTFITRKEFVGPDGKVYQWNVARIRGVLKDMSQSTGAIVLGVPNQEVTLYWGFGKTWQKTFELRTDSNGNFEKDIPIAANHALGPVPVRVTFSTEYLTNYYDSSTMVDNDGQPFSVVSFTTLEVNASTAVKGKPISVTGFLKDDRQVGIGNRTIKLYRKETWGGNYNSLSVDLGTFIGTAKTNSIGKFTFNDYMIEEIMSVGSIWIVAKFDGSQQFPYGLGGVRYLLNDAYMDIIAYPTKMIITSETVVVLDQVPNVLVRNAEARITGKLLEMYRGKIVNRGVGGQIVQAYLKQGEEIFGFGAGKTKNDPNLPEFDGFFEIKATNIEPELEVGNVEVIVEFEPDVGAEGVALYQPSSNRTVAEVWSSTRVKEIYFGPTDEDEIPDGRFDIFENKVDNLIFTYQVLEGTSDIGGEPVTYGVVWLNISMGPYVNTTRAITDIRGRVHFNFTAKLRDTATGNFFTLPADQDEANISIEVKFMGKQGFTSSSKTRIGTYHRYVPEPTPPPPVAMIIFIILIVLILGGIAMFFFYRYIERKRRLKSLKKIIKKAADQLEAGNPYSYIIFKAYQKLGAHLRRYGFMRRDADTFREFEDAVRSALPIDERSLDSFLDILEEARYSKHVIGENHKQKAIGCLRQVETSLDNIILDEEAALRQMELADEDVVETEIIGPNG